MGGLIDPLEAEDPKCTWGWKFCSRVQFPQPASTRTLYLWYRQHPYQIDQYSSRNQSVYVHLSKPRAAFLKQQMIRFLQRVQDHSELDTSRRNTYKRSAKENMEKSIPKKTWDGYIWCVTRRRSWLQTDHTGDKLLPNVLCSTGGTKPVIKH